MAKHGMLRGASENGQQPMVDINLVDLPDSQTPTGQIGSRLCASASESAVR
jgi:hypothetical protein